MMTVSQGYQDALAGRNNADSSPDYVKGWLTGFRERMLTWNSFSQPAGIDDVEGAKR
jgi:ribosome modulation factor